VKALKQTLLGVPGVGFMAAGCEWEQIRLVEKRSGFEKGLFRHVALEDTRGWSAPCRVGIKTSKGTDNERNASSHCTAGLAPSHLGRHEVRKRMSSGVQMGCATGTVPCLCRRLLLSAVRRDGAVNAPSPCMSHVAMSPCRDR
jgi:hypothetical protein